MQPSRKIQGLVEAVLPFDRFWIKKLVVFGPTPMAFTFPGSRFPKVWAKFTGLAGTTLRD